MNELSTLHVGRGTTRGGLTIFPLWGETAAPASYTTRGDAVAVRELDDAQVGTLVAVNESPQHVLLLEGQVLEGGRQHRMVARSVLLAGGAAQPVDVVCVEQGRWSGDGGHASRGRRGSLRVRAGLRSPDRQGEVWRRVGEYDARYGHNTTTSFVEHAERAVGDVAHLTAGLRPFPGQVGVMVGIGGYPVSAEVFDTPEALAEQFEGIVAAAAMDAVGAPAVETPSRRARSFLDHAAAVRRRPAGRAGLAVATHGRDPDADVASLVWHDRPIYTLLTNPRHSLTLAA